MKRISQKQAKLIKNYTSPSSPTQGNMYQSAKKAGYSESYSRTVSSKTTKNLSEYISKEDLVKKAEQVLNDCLYFEDEDNKVGAGKIRQDTAKFILNSTSKYSAKQEQKIAVSGLEEARQRLGRILQEEK
jgi:protein associated with RNAse G/E